MQVAITTMETQYNFLAAIYCGTICTNDVHRYILLHIVKSIVLPQLPSCS